MADLDEAVTFHLEALSLWPLDHSNRSVSLDNLASAVLTRYDQSGRIEDLEGAITYYQEASHRPLGQPDRSRAFPEFPHYSWNLSNAVLTRYIQLGHTNDLAHAIIYYGEAFRDYSPGHPDRSVASNNFASALLTRYYRSGGIWDLDDAITSYHEACSSLSHPDCYMSLNNLGNVTLTRYRHLGRKADLEAAITFHREALGLWPPGHSDRSVPLNNLASAVFARYDQLGGMKDLEDAITYYHEALSLLPFFHPDRTTSLNNLANAVFPRYKHSTRRMKDLEEVITHRREALSLHSPNHPDCSKTLKGLASAILARYVESGKAEDLEESFMLYEQAVNHLTASSKSRFTAAIECQWANAARQHHHSSVIRAYSMLLYFLNRCFISSTNMESLQRFLACIPPSLASDVAIIDANELGAAAGLLKGRGMLWLNLKDASSISTPISPASPSQ